MAFQRVDGPECPDCGCQDSTRLSEASKWGKKAHWRECRHCRRRWIAQSQAEAETNHGTPQVSHGEPVVVYPTPAKIHCPECNCTDTRVTTTRRPVRHHKCRHCGARFKSCEREG
ncbi:MAG: hypothetical protein JSU68_01405 [Phycisphaerales bacterium]|nr:MAG: hypothetical protein JSU68_01405 [Phycisphaerales bacterium]